ncbi:MAG: hypothetical protein GWP15_03210 [Nitrospirae bacterium]|nr:hypothetical protein [Nitrospirota bacterium]
MSTVIQDETYNLDRKTAGRLLKVSIRTIDRYIKAKKLSTSLVDGRVWLNKRELEEVCDRRRSRVSAQVVDMSTPRMSTDTMVDEVDKVELVEHESVDSVSIKNRKRKTSSAVYKKLYADLKEELHEKQERLEIANYRVGQLEAQVKNSIPMLEYHQEKFEKEQEELKLQEQISERNSLIKKIMSQAKHEKFNKRIFLGVLLIILALQPLWLLLIYK